MAVSTLARRKPAAKSAETPRLRFIASMAGLAYNFEGSAAAWDWIQHRGSIDGCPAVEIQDWPAVNAIYEGLGRPVTAPACLGEVWGLDSGYAPGSEPYVPSEADEEWLAEQLRQPEKPKPAPAPAPKPTPRPARLAGSGVGDADQVRHHGCV